MEATIILVLFVGACLYFGLASKRRSSNNNRRNSGHSRSQPPSKRIIRPARSKADSKREELDLPPIPPSLTLSGKAYVIDGDTIRIQKTKIRIAGIDAPELDMPWGQKSKWAMVKICKGHLIRVHLDGERSYDRLVGTCYLPDGTDIGAEIVKQGLALDLPQFSGGKYRHLEPHGARRRLANGAFGHRSIKRNEAT